MLFASANAQELQPSEGMDEPVLEEPFSEPVQGLPQAGPSPSTEMPSPNSVDGAAPATPIRQPKNLNTAILQGLNKVTARTLAIEAPLGEVVRFGNLEIVARSCWQSAELTHPENAALLEIWELKAAEAPTRVFMGWMFASSPSLTALQHPVYDIVVTRCEDRELKDE